MTGELVNEIHFKLDSESQLDPGGFPMPFYTWTEELDVHVPAMNSEHQELIRLMNTLFDKNDQKAPKSEILQAIDSLVKYTVQHFTDEEAYMEKIQFEGVATHRIIHKQLLSQLGQFVAAFKSSSEPLLGKEFFNFLSVWLTSHIKGIDTKYAGTS